MRIRFIHPRIGQAKTRVPPGRDVVIGREGVDADIELPWDSRISRRHACVWQADGVLWFLDLDSHNGSWIGRERLRGPVRLDVGTSILLGETVLERMSSTAPPLSLEFEGTPTLEPDPAEMLDPPDPDAEDTRDLSSMREDVTMAMRVVTRPTVIPATAPADTDALRFDDSGRIVGRLDRDALLKLWREGLRRDGLYVNTPAPPPLNTDLPIELKTPDGPLSLRGRVVSVLSPEQARSAGMSPGAGIDVRWSAGQRDALEAYLQHDRRQPGTSPSAESGLAREILQTVRSLLRAYEAESFYAALGLPPAVKRHQIAERHDELLASIEVAGAEVSPPQQARLRTARAALARMRRVLLNDEARLEHDFRLGIIDAERRLSAAETGGPNMATLRHTFNRVQPEAVEEAARLTREAFASKQAGEHRTALHLAQRAFLLNPFFVELKEIISGWQRRLEAGEPDSWVSGRPLPKIDPDTLKDR